MMKGKKKGTKKYCPPGYKMKADPGINIKAIIDKYKEGLNPNLVKRNTPNIGMNDNSRDFESTGVVDQATQNATNDYQNNDKLVKNSTLSQDVAYGIGAAAFLHNRLQPKDDVNNAPTLYSYQPFSNGTGSQAIAKYGAKIFEDGGNQPKKLSIDTTKAKKVDKVPEGYRPVDGQPGYYYIDKQAPSTAKKKPVTPNSSSSTNMSTKKTTSSAKPMVRKPVKANTPPMSMQDVVYMEQSPNTTTPDTPQLTEFDPFSYGKGYDGKHYLGADGKTGVWKSRLSGVQGSGLNDQSVVEDYVMFPYSEQSGKLKNGIDPSKTDWIDRDKGMWRIPANFPGGIRNNRLEDMRGYANPDASKAKGLSKYYQLMDGTNEGAFRFLDAASKDPDVVKQFGNLRVDSSMQTNGSAFYPTSENSQVPQQNNTLGNSANKVAPKLSFANQNGKYIPYANGKAIEGQSFDKPEDVQKYLFGYKPQMDDGGKVKKRGKGQLMAMVNELGGKHQGGLSVEDNKYKHISKDTIEFTGPKHEEGGIDISFDGQPVEVEGGETAFTGKDGSLNVLGNMKVPGTKTNFDTMGKKLASKEKKYQDMKYLGADLVNESDISSKKMREHLKFNAGKVMMKANHSAEMQTKDKLENLAALQNAMLSTANDLGEDPKKLFAKNGKKIMGLTTDIFDDGGKKDKKEPKKWKFDGTSTDKLNPKIKELVTLLESKGYQGVSGPDSGYSNRNTKSGRKSRHASNEALDAIFDGLGEKAYETIMKDKDVVNYLINNGLTLIDEYDPNTASKTGATAGHIHIGFDKGTDVSDKFRKDVMKLYPEYTQDVVNKALVSATTTKPIPNQPFVGDAQNFPLPPSISVPNTNTPVDKPVTTTTPNTNTGTPYTPQPLPEFTPQGSYEPPLIKNPLGFEQIAPEILALATNKQQAVDATYLNPELKTPYEVSFQDLRNENQADYNAISKELVSQGQFGQLSQLAANKYRANESVTSGQEFRTNQGIRDAVYQYNTETINQFNVRNQAISELQNERQAAAQANTWTQDMLSTDSLFGKVSQNKLETKTANLYSQLMPHMKYNEKDGRWNYNPESPDPSFTIPNAMGIPTSGNSIDPSAKNTMYYYDNKGRRIGKKEYETLDKRTQSKWKAYKG